MGDERRFRLDEAREVAEALLGALQGTFVQAQVAGSIRRARSWVHDVDLVIQPRFEGRRANLLGEQMEISLLDERLSALAQKGELTLTQNGPKAKRGIFQDIPFDVYVTTAETWPVVLLIRTGSALHNVMLCKRARDRNMLLKADGSGLFRSQRCNSCGGVGCARCGGGGVVPGQQVDCPSEDAIFKALGMASLPPAMREVQQETQGQRQERSRPRLEESEIY